jgi:hypothetical protein
MEASRDHDDDALSAHSSLSTSIRDMSSDAYSTGPEESVVSVVVDSVPRRVYGGIVHGVRKGGAPRHFVTAKQWGA